MSYLARMIAVYSDSALCQTLQMAVISYNSKFLTVVFLLLIEDAIAQENDVIVSPSCSSQSCRTLSQTSSLTSSHLSLILLPGNHTLNSSLSFEDKATFSLKGMSGEITLVRCIHQSVNIQIQDSLRVSINEITFHGCNLLISDSNYVNVSNTRIMNAFDRVLRVYDSSNVTIDQSNFNNNNQTSVYYGILELSRSKNFAITRSNFTNNSIFYLGAVYTRQSRGFISCCNFTNNTVTERFGGIVVLGDDSLVYVTNSTFLRNDIIDGSIVRFFGRAASAVIISSVFWFNILGSYGSAVATSVLYRGSATVLASEFYHLTAGFSIRTRQQNNDIVIIGCNVFHSNSTVRYSDIIDSHVQILSDNSNGCSRYAIGENGVCTGSNCEGTYNITHFWM